MRYRAWVRAVLASSIAASVVGVGCSASDGSGSNFGTGGAGNQGGGANAGGTNTGGVGNMGGGGVGNVGNAGGNDGGGGFMGDPKTCAEAEQAKTYIGCDFWPTVVSNNVWNIFDFAVVVANYLSTPADITIERPGAATVTGTVPPDGLQKFYLDWVPELKGPEAGTCGEAQPVTETKRVPGGAYHLTSTVPVTVYQFNALEYRGQGGPPGKDWSSCPGYLCGLPGIGCFSYSNDASLLLPSTALTANYRITSQYGWQLASIAGYFAVTGIQDGTNVTVKLSTTAAVTAGGGIQSAGPGSVFQFPIGRGEVVQVLGTATNDLSGTLVQTDGKPIQIIAGIPCINQPFEAAACDHVEESVFPAETLGERYFVTPPTGPLGNVPGHIVRIYGNVDGTILQYPSGAPPGAPTQIFAGEVVDLGIVSQAFEITGDNEFAVGSFQLGGTIVDPMGGLEQKGDPAQSLMTAVEQYRTKYVFLAPDDYDVSYVDIVAPDGASINLDGAAPNGAATPIGSGYSVIRAQLGPGNQGAHRLESDKPVGIQVMGYGSYTSYQYPGGLNLTLIAPPPPPVQ